uniref:M23 family metallopeptidase n=1 Tax=Alistipes putredinis TaxID=28117 RepID=UPI003FD80C58
MRRLLISALLLCSAPVSAQHLAPEDYIFPLRDVAGLYSANFGEMRPNHFHSGIDIKTDGVTGKPVLATADGYISRIAVTPGGYGRAIYITHPNGTTSVYGHLSKFRDDIEKYVHEERYRTRRNSINLYPPADRFPLKQGEQFAWSGNTGSSAGPHLHFEIRDSRTQRTLNTISSGVIRTRDDIPPRLVKLYYVEVDSVRGVPVHARPRPVELVEKTPGRYALKQEGALSVGGRGYFILETTDRKNDVSNTFGLWRIREFADEDPIFELRIDGFAFDQTRYCNAVTHYPMQVASRNEVIRLTRLDGCIDDFYPVLKNQALLTPSEGQSQQIRIEAEDDSGNRSILEFRTIRAYVPQNLQPHTTLGFVRKGKVSYAGGKYKNGAVTLSTRTLGDFCVVADTVPPRIEPRFKAGEPIRTRSITFRLRDNFSGIGSYTATLDGEWILLERNPMQGTITHTFDDSRTPKGRSYTLQLTVTDNCGNKTVWKRTITR